MKELQALIDRLRSGELSMEDFVSAAAAKYVRRIRQENYDDDIDAAYANGISAATVATAVRMGLLEQDEAQAIYDAVG